MHSDRRTEAPREPAGATTGPVRLPGAAQRRPSGQSQQSGQPQTAYEKIGPYRLIGKVGEGGMGVVYKAFDPRDQIVAVKVLRAHIAYDAGARERLRREVSTLSMARSNRIGWVLDADVDGDRPFLVTRYVNGPPLDAVVDEFGPLAPGPLAILGRGVAEALRDIHGAGIVHRDLKPGNVLMDGDEPVLIDFGIAHVADESRLTSTGLVMGTPGYLSPEIVEGGEVTEATDWWGWAATLAFAASGVPPFGRGPMHAVLDRVSEGRADLQGVDPRLRPLLAAALSPDPDQRPSAHVVLEQLEIYAAGGHTTTIAIRRGDSAVPAGSSSSAAPRARGDNSSPYDDRSNRFDRAPVRRPEPTVSYERSAPRASDPYGYAPPLTHGRADDEPYRYAGEDDAPAGYDGYDGSSPYDSPASVSRQQSGSHLDPRIGQSARTGTLAALAACVIAVCAHWPIISVILIFGWSCAARWSDRAITSMVLRRFQSGPRKSDSLVAVATSPWHAIVGAFSALLTMVIPAFVAGCVVAAAAVGMHLVDHQPTSVGRPIPLALGVLAGLTVLWWGPGSTGMRRGSRSIVRSVARDEVRTRVVIGLCAAVAAVAVLVVVNAPLHEVSWLPYSSFAQLPLANVMPSLPGS